MSDHMTTHQAEKEAFRIADTFDTDIPENFRGYAHSVARRARTLGRIGERECNGVRDPATGHQRWNDADQAMADRQRKSAEETVRAAFKAMYGSAYDRMVIEFQGDPRGPAIYVHVAGGMQRIATFW